MIYSSNMIKYVNNIIKDIKHKLSSVYLKRVNANIDLDKYVDLCEIFHKHKKARFNDSYNIIQPINNFKYTIVDCSDDYGYFIYLD